MPSDITCFVTTCKIETLITNSLTDFVIGELCGAPLDDRNIFKPSSKLVLYFKTVVLKHSSTHEVFSLPGKVIDWPPSS
jgi:hypothetical protein